MGLFIDGPAIAIDDLIAEDSGLLATAQTVGINVTAKLGLAMSEVQSELETLLLRLQTTTTGTVGLIQPPSIGQVVVTPDLARWEKMQALTMVYRDAAYTQLIDRYKSKWDMFTALNQAARNQFVANGMGLVNSPVPQAAIPILGTESVTSTQAGGTFYACVTWVNATGQEGSPSAAASIVVPANNLMTVMATGAPANAVGFNVYVGNVLAMMTLQNNVVLPVGSTFTYVPGISTSSQLPGTGQVPDYVKALPATIQRG